LVRKSLPEQGSDWETLREQMLELGKDDVDWRRGRTAVYVFNPGEDVLRVAKDAYGLYQSENGLGPAAFPSLERMESDVVDMGLSLLNAPEGACGDMTSGGSESIFLAVKTCRDAARAAGRDTSDGEIVVARSAHPAFDKAAHFLGLRVVRVPVGEDLCADVQAMSAAATDRTLMLVGSAPCYPYGLVDPIPELSQLAVERDLWLHVDACVGGYFAPFARMNGVELPEFDFALPGVRSISADLHKYGYAAKGASTIFHRSAEQREHQLFVFDDWPSGGMTTPTAAGTRPGGAIASAWAVLHYLGVEGYREKTKAVCDTRERLVTGLAELGFAPLGDPKLALLAFASQELDAFAIWGAMLERGWFTGLTTEPRSVHMMLSPAHRDFADEYLADLAKAADAVRAGAKGPDEARYS
jgi:glutamate/tyrosine decarboxylase-like PLP-dependent enzyme